MESRKDIAAEKKASFKFNCAQSVLTTYGDLTGLDEATAMSMTDGFAAGMTNTEWYLRCADWCRHGSRTGQQGQGEDDETDADDHAEIPGP